MFTPPCCPYRTCVQHSSPDPSFYTRHGSYRAKCRAHPVPRFRCKSCLRTFSRQTFRMDYRDHKPHCNVPLFLMLASGVGLRQASRNLGLSLRCAELKFRKIARHARRLNLNLRGPLGEVATFHFDEFETFEEQRNARPLSIPMLVESETRYIVWAESAPIRPRGKMTPKRRRDVLRAESRHGPRRDTSRRSVGRALQRGVDIASSSRVVVLETDEKSSYPGLAREAFGEDRLVHRTTNSKLVRATFNPLFAVNNEEAIARHSMGRLHRESWLVSKKRRYLDLALQLHMTYRNLIRLRFNYDRESAAQLLGFVPRRLQPAEALSWRQDWGEWSPDPFSRSGRTHRDRLAAAA